MSNGRVALNLRLEKHLILSFEQDSLYFFGLNLLRSSFF